MCPEQSVSYVSSSSQRPLYGAFCFSRRVWLRMRTLFEPSSGAAAFGGAQRPSRCLAALPISIPRSKGPVMGHSVLLSRKPQFPHLWGLFVLVSLHAAEDVVEHLDRREYMWALIEHDAVGSL